MCYSDLEVTNKFPKTGCFWKMKQFILELWGGWKFKAKVLAKIYFFIGRLKVKSFLVSGDNICLLWLKRGIIQIPVLSTCACFL